MRLALLAVLALLLAACFSTGTREPQRYYVLEPAAGRTTPERVARPARLIVAPTDSASFYNTQDIVYSRSPGTRAYYQFNSWTEPPGRSIHALLVFRLQRSGAFRDVAASGSGVGGGLVLTTYVEEMYHDAAAAPGSARITLRAELANPGQDGLIGQRSFSRSAQAASYDAQGAVKGFAEALGALLEEVVAWVDETAPR